jgi:hypothetical protein
LNEDHPVRLTIIDDLQRSRLTVFFRLLLAIPHFLWLVLWGVAVVVCAFINWVIVLFTAESSRSLHDFLAAYIRYATHVVAYVSLAANPFPGFVGEPGYPVDVQIAPPARQNRWVTGFRLILAVPAFVIAGLLLGGGSSAGARGGFYGGVVSTAAFLGWFVCLARRAMPRGLRDLNAYSIGYAAQVDAYLLILTDRYPNADPAAHLPSVEPPPHPVRLTSSDDLRRSRLTVFFRLFLAIPHIVWLVLWGIAAVFALIANWFVTLFTTRPAEALHRFLSSYLRYANQVYAYISLLTNPFPGFTGDPGSYPIEVELPPPEPQNRWITGFRLFLAIPAFLLAAAIGSLLHAAAILGWFAALATGRMPGQLQRLGAFALRYSAQAIAYLYLITERYPYSGPSVSERPPQGAPSMVEQVQH